MFLQVVNTIKRSPITFNFLDTLNIKNTKTYDNQVSFEYRIIHGWSTHSPIELDLTNFPNKSLHLSSRLTLKNGVTYTEHIYISDYTQIDMQRYIYRECYKGDKEAKGYKSIGEYFPKDSLGNPDLKMFK